MDNELGKRLREKRASMGLTVRELAYLTGVSFSLISKIENGQRSISLPLLYRLQLRVFDLDDNSFETLLQLANSHHLNKVATGTNNAKGGEVLWRIQRTPARIPTFKLTYPVT